MSNRAIQHFNNVPMGSNHLGGMNGLPCALTEPGGGQMIADAVNLANNLLNNLFHNQHPPMLGRNQRGVPMANRVGGQVGNRGGRGGARGRNRRSFASGGSRNQNDADHHKKNYSKNANSNNQFEVVNENLTEMDESPYSSVPNHMFNCHLCNKRMWDAHSFENHVKGRVHNMILDGVVESYRLKANMMRQKAKLAEQIQSNVRFKLTTKGRQSQPNYCAMCDLHFQGLIAMHRKSEDHVQLKKFLHPKCFQCNKEFSSRVDYDIHLLSPNHLKKAADKTPKLGDRERQIVPINTIEKEKRDIHPPQKRKRSMKKNSNATGEGEEVADEAKEGKDLLDDEDNEGSSLVLDGNEIILDFIDGDDIPSDVTNRLPVYNWQRGVGVSLIKKLECFQCIVCSKCFDNDITAEIHTRTVTHHRNFLKLIKDKAIDTKTAQKRAAAELQDNKAKRRKVEEAETKAGPENDQDGAQNLNEANSDDDVEMVRLIENSAGGDDAHYKEGILPNVNEATVDDNVEMKENLESADIKDDGGEKQINNKHYDKDDDDDVQIIEDSDSETDVKPEPEPSQSQTLAPVVEEQEMKTLQAPIVEEVQPEQIQTAAPASVQKESKPESTEEVLKSAGDRLKEIASTEEAVESAGDTIEGVASTQEVVETAGNPLEETPSTEEALETAGDSLEETPSTEEALKAAEEPPKDAVANETPVEGASTTVVTSETTSQATPVDGGPEGSTLPSTQETPATAAGSSSPAIMDNADPIAQSLPSPGTTPTGTDAAPARSAVIPARPAAIPARPAAASTRPTSKQGRRGGGNRGRFSGRGRGRSGRY